MRQSRRHSLIKKWSSLIIMCSVCLGLLVGGYFLYQKSIESAVGSTTLSYMEQLAEHDIRNVSSQFDSRLSYLHSLSERLSLVRKEEQSDIPYLMSVEAQATQFKKLYLITDQEQVYDSAYLITSLDAMPWGEFYRSVEDDFICRFVIDNREAWGEYLLYGIKLEKSVPYGDEQVKGIVGLVPIDELSGLINLKSFDGQGMTLVIEPNGTIITASRYYDQAHLNYFAELEQAEFLNGTSLEQCRQAIDRGESLYIEYVYEAVQYNAMLKPIGEEDYGSGWTMVVKVPQSVTANQTRSLMSRSLVFFALLSVVVVALAAFVFKSMRAAQLAQASEQAKSTFLANMSHEIRTPLNGITGLLYLMRQNLNDKQKLGEYLEKAEVSADFLKSVITEVLDMSKIESGQLELYCQPLDLQKVIDQIQMLIESQARGRGIDFEVDCERLSKRWVIGDEVRLKQIIVNLLGNALKFTPKQGRISLKVSQSPQGKLANTTFEIADTGCGMSPQFLEKIWLPFEQEHRLESQNGTGLGTTLSKLLAEKMGGSITVDSRVGEGTTFTVQIPFELSEPMAEPEAAAVQDRTSLKGKRILAAEDNAINREILEEILKEYGAEVTCAVNGQEAVDLFQASPVHAYDVILMDIQMPVMNGYEASSAIRALDRGDSRTIPIFALTANAFKQEADQALNSGMNDVITKPLDIAVLLEKLSAVKPDGDNKDRKTDLKGENDE